MMPHELARTDAVTLARLIREKAVSPSEVIADVCSIIERDNARLNAFCTLCLEQAVQTAREIEARLARGESVGPLAGVPVSIKDLIMTKSIRTTGGAVAYRDFVPGEDDIVVERVKAAGAVVLGKTNVSELGYGLTGDNPLFGITRNPWDHRHTSGGSSAGAAVAVATGMGPIAIGSDGGGSIRVPAAFCGVFGFKPSMGRVPLYPGCRDERYPGFSSWESLEHIGPLTRTVADTALLLSVMAGPDKRDRHSIPSDIHNWSEVMVRSISGYRVAYCPTWGGASVDRELEELTGAAVTVFERDLGCPVDTIESPWSNPVPHFRTLMALDSDLTGMRKLLQQSMPDVSINLQRFLAVEWTAEAMTDAVKFRKHVCNVSWKLFDRFDLLLTPMTTAPTPLADKQDGRDDIERPLPTFTCIANMTGLPAASVPIGRTRAGLPVGLQIIGGHLADHLVLSSAAAFERLHPWHNEWPSAAS